MNGSTDEFFSDLDIGGDEPFSGGNAPQAPEPAPAPTPSPDAVTGGGADPGGPPAGGSAPAAAPAPTPDGTGQAPAAAAAPSPTVPVAALVSERKQFQAELAARDARLKDLEDRLAKLTPPAPPPPPPEPQRPDFIEDPQGYVDGSIKPVLEKLEKLEKVASTATTQMEQERQLADFVSQVQSVEQQFIAANPDYHDALNHVREVRVQQLALVAPPDTPREQLLAVVAQEELQFAAANLQAGRNPADAAYRFARTVGYQPKAPAAGGQQQGQQAPVIPAFPQGQAPNAAAASRTLGTGGAPPVGADPTSDGLGDGLDAMDAALRERFGRA